METNGFGSSYSHTQYARWLLFLVLGVAVFMATLGPPHLIARVGVTAVLLIIAWLFHSLTIEIVQGELRWRFGPGLIHKSVPLAEIAGVRAVRTNIAEGWGIHWSRFGLLYNVSGYDAVAITLRSGRRFAIGTDDPQQLCARLEALLR